MQATMLRLDAFLRRRHRAVLGAWIVLLIAAVPLALRQSDNLTGGGFGVPGSESQKVATALTDEFPIQASRASLAAVIVPAKDTTQPQLTAVLNEVSRAAQKTGQAQVTPAAKAGALRGFQADSSKPVLVPLQVATDDIGAGDIASDLRKDLGLADRSEPIGLHLVGQTALYAGLQDVSKEGLAKAEGTGFPIVLLILLAVFGSLAAASLPLALGLVSVLTTGALIYLLSSLMEMSVFVTNMASMVGIGVAVDYSLFVLARYREEVRAGRDPDEARGVALATSGVAVLFSGATVIVSLAGLYMVNTTAIRSMALGAILVVAVSMLGAATLLPVLIRTLGHRAYARGRIFSVMQLVARSRARRRAGSTAPDAPVALPFWERWTAAVMRRPKRALLGSVAILLLLGIPALSLQTGNGALRQFPDGNETRAGFEAAASVAGPGDFAPVRVTTPARDADRTAKALRADRDIASVAKPLLSTDGTSALLLATPRYDGESPQTKELVTRLRDTLPSATQVGGTSAQQDDFAATVSDSMWKIVLFVMAMSYLVLMVLLRSVILPLKAVIANLLSVGAAYGVLVAVFQWGWVDGFLGFQSPGEIDTITPPLVLAVVFGLSMDYEVFLLSRIRERFTATGDTQRAVSEGLTSSARTITSAAVIMVSVFAVFVGDRRAVDQGAWSRQRRRDRGRRNARPPDPRPGRDAAAGQVELVDAARPRPRAARGTPRRVRARPGPRLASAAGMPSRALG